MFVWTWNDEQIEYEISVMLKELPFCVRLFKVVAVWGYGEWAIITDSDSTVTMQVAQK